jgi:hypothetical protein
MHGLFGWLSALWFNKYEPGIGIPVLCVKCALTIRKDGEIGGEVNGKTRKSNKVN